MAEAQGTHNEVQSSKIVKTGKCQLKDSVYTRSLKGTLQTMKSH